MRGKGSKPQASPGGDTRGPSHPQAPSRAGCSCPLSGTDPFCPCAALSCHHCPTRHCQEQRRGKQAPSLPSCRCPAVPRTPEKGKDPICAASLEELCRAWLLLSCADSRWENSTAPRSPELEHFQPHLQGSFAPSGNRPRQSVPCTGLSHLTAFSAATQLSCLAPSDQLNHHTADSRSYWSKFAAPALNFASFAFHKSFRRAQTHCRDLLLKQRC